jgi:hypothetical protein
MMKKTEAIELLGGDIASAIKALRIARKTMYNWPDDLTIALEDRVRGCYARITEERDRAATVILG